MLNTSKKIFIARALCAVVMSVRQLFSLSANVIKLRGGIKWSLNLREGIDLAIFVLGGFEVRTLRKYKQLVKNGDIILDIGANIGAHTLPLANLVGEHGKIIAFEPTKYAFDKLKTNISLNPNLAMRITPQQMMLVNSASDKLPAAIYSSWPLESSNDLHKDHRGRLMSTDGAIIATLDQFIQSSHLQHINLIKLDVDGNEYDVLIGGQETLRQFKPTLIMELSPCGYDACPEKFDDILKLLWRLGYEIVDIASGKKLPIDPLKIRHFIPAGGSINALVLPSS